jgi:sugar/nucleoside kinase (ribokinase family)
MALFDLTLAGDTALDMLLYGLPDDLPPERELLVKSMELALGGSAAITAHNAAVLGLRVGLITPRGDDMFAAMCLRQLEEAGVDLSRTVPSLVQGGFTVMLQHDEARRALTFPGNATGLRFRDLDVDYLANARHFHLSSFFLQHALQEDVPRLLSTLKDAGLTISMDTNDDPWDRWSGSIASSLGLVDILMPNEREVRKLTGISDTAAAIEKLRREVPILVVKRGTRGATVFQGEFEETQPAVTASFLDAIGAGDSFNAGFLSAYLRDATLSECLHRGNLAGAYSTTQAGGTTAFRERQTLEQFMAHRH